MPHAARLIASGGARGDALAAQHPARGARRARLSETLREAVLAAITVPAAPERAPAEAPGADRVAARAVALRAVLAEAPEVLSPAERNLLGESGSTGWRPRPAESWRVWGKPSEQHARHAEGPPRTREEWLLAIQAFAGAHSRARSVATGVSQWSSNQKPRNSWDARPRRYAARTRRRYSDSPTPDCWPLSCPSSAEQQDEHRGTDAQVAQGDTPAAPSRPPRPCRSPSAHAAGHASRGSAWR